MFSEWFQIALDFVFPAECQYCHGFLGDARVVIFCRACWQQIRVITEPRCPHCGLPYPTDSAVGATPGFLCGNCRAAPPFFDRACAAAYYENILQESIHQFKFQQKIALGRPLAQILITQLPPDLDLAQYHAIVPVPLHPQRYRQRGYNQSTILAKYLAQHAQVPLMLHNLCRIRSPASQALMMKGRKARLANVKDAFAVKFPELLRDKAIILIDDVITTGATVNECAKTLKKAGAKSVLVLALSRRRLYP